MSLGGIILTAVIEAHKLRHIAWFDIPGVFLHTKCKDRDICKLLKGKLTELVTLVKPKLYHTSVWYTTKGEAMLYVKMTKTLYLKSALWFYQKLKVDLENYGFTVNPCDPCVANTMVNGKQTTVTWHVDDLKVLHEDPVEITKFANYLAIVIHGYLNMDLNYTRTDKVGIGHD